MAVNYRGIDRGRERVGATAAMGKERRKKGIGGDDGKRGRRQSLARRGTQGRKGNGKVEGSACIVIHSACRGRC